MEALQINRMREIEQLARNALLGLELAFHRLGAAYYFVRAAVNEIEIVPCAPCKGVWHKPGKLPFSHLCSCYYGSAEILHYCRKEFIRAAVLHVYQIIFPACSVVKFYGNSLSAQLPGNSFSVCEYPRSL